MQRKNKLTDAELNSPLFPETTEILIPFGPANEQFQQLQQKHKELGSKLQHDTRRLALALAQRIRTDGSQPTAWEMALMEQAGLGVNELPAYLETQTLIIATD